MSLIGTIIIRPRGGCTSAKALAPPLYVDGEQVHFDGNRHGRGSGDGELEQCDSDDGAISTKRGEQSRRI